jgi:hypothetical protein
VVDSSNRMIVGINLYLRLNFLTSGHGNQLGVRRHPH